MIPMSDDHYLIPHYDPPVYGDRPEPWRRYATCSCGEELWEEEEGRGGTAGTAEDALARHVALETSTCECGADLEEDACPNSPDRCLDCCEEDHSPAAALAVTTSSSRPAIEYLQHHRP